MLMLTISILINFNSIQNQIQYLFQNKKQYFFLYLFKIILSFIITFILYNINIIYIYIIELQFF